MGFLDLLRQSVGFGERPSPWRSLAMPRQAPVPRLPFPTPCTRFPVSDVRPATTLLGEEPYRMAVDRQLKPVHQVSREEIAAYRQLEPGWSPPAAEDWSPVEACCTYRGRLVADVYRHPFVAAAELAFAQHRPLALSPDMIWLLIMQGFSHHVAADAERLRPQLVTHRGKIALTVRRDDFVKGSPENPWEEVFAEMSGQVRHHIGGTTHDLLMPTFSTTGEVERAAAQVVLLGAMRSYFDYRFLTLCGIPGVALEGTAADWDALIERTRPLARFGLEWWTRPLLRVLDEFRRAARGDVRLPFWRSLYKENDQSGGPYLTGWVGVFFPYLLDRDTGQATCRNQTLTAPAWERRESEQPWFGGGPTLEWLPSGLSRVPFVWQYMERHHPMELLAGFTGVRQDPATFTLRPEIGWAVRERAGA